MRIFSVFAGLGILLSVTASAQFPDLRPEITNLQVLTNQTVDAADVAEGCADGTENRTLVTFDHTAWNDGPGDFLPGDPQCPDCATENPVCGNSNYECSVASGHNHAHLRDFSHYTVSREGEVAAHGHKEGFCLVNTTCVGEPPDTSGAAECSILSAGCADVYLSGLGCQYVDVTNLAPGNYTLRVELNPSRSFVEAVYDNNIVEQSFKLCRTTHKLDIKIQDAIGPFFRRPFVLRGKIALDEGTKLDPLKNGIQFALQLDDRSGFGQDGFGPGVADLPAGKKGCLPGDGWEKLSPHSWRYTNRSGYSNDCTTFVTGGVNRAFIQQKGNKLYAVLRGELELVSVPPRPKSATFRLVDFTTTANNGTCLATAIRACRYIGEDKDVLSCH